MDIGELKKQSDLSYDIAIAKRNALEKAKSRQVIVYNEHIFCADTQTICMVKTLKDLYTTFFVLDSNNNPVEIQNSHFAPRYTSIKSLLNLLLT